jgi:hypothetical protein
MATSTIAKKGRDVGRIVTSAVIENIEDLLLVRAGHRKPEEVRRIGIAEALVDTGTTFLSLPKSVLQKLGLGFQYTRRGITPGGSRRVRCTAPCDFRFKTASA